MDNQFDSKGGEQNVGQGDHAIGQQNNCGIPPEVFAHYAKELDMTKDDLQDFLIMLLEHDLARQRKDLLARLGDDQAVRQAVEAGDYAKAEELLEDAARRRTLAAAEVCAAQARLQEVQLRYAKAAAYWQKAAALLPEESKEERLLCLREAGSDLERIGKHTEEVSIFEQMLALYQELGDRKQERTTLNHISCLHRKQGNYAAALSHLEQSLRISHEIGHRNQRVATLYTMLYLHGVQGDHPAFLRCRELIRQENGGNGAINSMDDIMWSAGGMRKAKHMLCILERSESILRVV